MNISPESVIFSERLKSYLKLQREKGFITPENPILAREIVAIAGRKKDKDGNPVPNPIEVTKEEVYKVVHFLREADVPIASYQRGYCYALVPEDFDAGIAEQKRKLREVVDTMKLMLKLRSNLFKANNSIFPEEINPKIESYLDKDVIDILNEGFDIEIPKDKNAEHTVQEETHD
jgi:hypothetical protein